MREESGNTGMTAGTQDPRNTCMPPGTPQARLPAHGRERQSRRWRHRIFQNAQRPRVGQHSKVSKRWATRGSNLRPPADSGPKGP